MQPKPHRRFSFLALPYGKGPSQTVGEVFVNINKTSSVALRAPPSPKRKANLLFLYRSLDQSRLAANRKLPFLRLRNRQRLA